MARIPGLRRLMRLERGQNVERAVDDELRFHFDMTVEQLANGGLTPDQARREAERRFGDLQRTRERLTTIDRERVAQDRRADWWSAAGQDIRYALRGLRLKPGFAAVVVLTLGLGIGANAAMFGIVDRLLFRPPAYMVAPDRTHHLYFARTSDGTETIGGNTQYQRLLDLVQHSRTMEIIGGYSSRRTAVGIGESAREMRVGALSANLWRLFNARPLMGRFFTVDEDREPAVSRVVVLSYGFWKSEYGGSPDVLGKTLQIGPAPYTIIGVAPRGFSAVEMIAPSAFIPLGAAAVDGMGSLWTRYRTTYNLTWLEVYGRRRAGVSATAATADLSRAYQESWRAQTAIDPRAQALDGAKPRVIVGSILPERGPSPSAETKVATWLLGVASIVLLIACANVGNLLLGRAFARRREIAVRIALGVRRLRLARQLLIESLLLALLGAGAGLAIAQWGGRVLRSTLIPQVQWENALADKRVLIFAGASALLAGLLAGLAPIVQAGRSDVTTALKASAREGYGQRSRTRTALLVLQAALSVVLLVGAGLFVKSLQNVQTLHLGYDADRLVWIEPRLRGLRLDSVQQVTLRRDLVDRAMRNPLVENASLVFTVPFAVSWGDEIFAPTRDSVRKLKDVLVQMAQPSFFATTGTRILKGRTFTKDDSHGAPRVVVVSRELARQAWPAEDAIGKCLRVSADTMPCSTVVGIAEDIRLSDFTGPIYPMMYAPAAQVGENEGSLYVRVKGNAAVSAEAVRRDLQRVMPGSSFLIARTLSDVIAPATRSWRLGATMFAVFGCLALALAAIGLYSVIAYSVTQRTHEMGVRIALGARVADVVSMIVRDGLRVVTAGVAIGLVAALLGGKWLVPLLFKVSPKDPMVYAGVALLLLAVAVLASWVPALRASRVDPAKAMRAD